MSVGDDFHGSEKAAEGMVNMGSGLQLVRALSRERDKTAKLEERLRVRTALLRRTLDWTNSALAREIEAELAKDKEPTP
jgi:hypothetical protein